MSKELINRLKTLAIVLLSASALVLTFMANRYYGFMSFSPETDESSDTVIEAARPVEISVNNEFGRYGVALDDTALDEMYSRLGRYLGEALGTVIDREAIDFGEFSKLLKQQSICYRFPGNVPLSALAKWLGTGLPQTVEDSSGDIFAVVADNEQIRLIYKADDVYYICTTESRADLFTELAEYRPNGVSLALELSESNSVYNPQGLYLVVGQPVLSVAAAENTLSVKRNQLASELGFNPYGDSSYTDKDGSEVFTANNSILTLNADGLIEYKKSSTSGKLPETAERIEIARKLLSELADAGDAELYFTGESVDGTVSTLTFDYYYSGVLIETSYDHAATVTITGESITGVQLYLRRYTKTEQLISLIPSLQAAAMSRGELVILYKDDGGDSIVPGWVS